MTHLFQTAESTVSGAGVACAMAVANALIPGGEKSSGLMTGDTLIGETLIIETLIGETIIGETIIGETIIGEMVISLIGAG
jgi:predicted small integral membrane protein